MMLFSSPLLSVLVASSGLFHGVLAAPSNKLADCASKALTGDDVDIRIQQPSDDTWEDVRVGAIMSVLRDNKVPRRDFLSSLSLLPS